MSNEGNRPYTDENINWILTRLSEKYGVLSDTPNPKGFILSFGFHYCDSNVLIIVSQSPEVDLALLDSHLDTVKNTAKRIIHAHGWESCIGVEVIRK